MYVTPGPPQSYSYSSPALLSACPVFNPFCARSLSATAEEAVGTRPWQGAVHQCPSPQEIPAPYSPEPSQAK